MSTKELKLDLKDSDANSDNNRSDEQQMVATIRRSRSVPVCKALISDTARMKRLLRFAKHSNPNDEEVFRKTYEEDEGYASKTSSAEEQMSKAAGEYQLHVIGTRSGQMEGTDAVLSNNLLMVNQKYARFSYTHEKYQSIPNTPRLLGAGILEPYKNNMGHTSRHNESGHLYNYRDRREVTLHNIQDIRPTSIVLKKISMQNSCSEADLESMEKIPEWNQACAIDFKPTATPRKLKLDEASKREQYPIHNTSPELKFGVKTRISATKVPYKSVSDSGRKSLRRSDTYVHDVAPRGVPEVDNQPTLALPLGELIPAMDRSIRNNQTPRNSGVNPSDATPTESNGSGAENTNNKNLIRQKKGGDADYTFPSNETKHALLKSSTDLLGRTIGQVRWLTSHDVTLISPKVT